MPTAELLRHWWETAVDLRHYTQPGHADDSVYDVRALRRELGFEAAATLAAIAQREIR